MKGNNKKRLNIESDKKCEDKTKEVKDPIIKKQKIKSIKEFNNIEENENYILAEINIEEDDINKDIRIIDTFEEHKRINDLDDDSDDYKKNEKEKKENCIIKINNKRISFNYFYKFKEKGKFIIKYLFKKNIKSANYLFSECNSLTKIDWSNFNTQNVTNMSSMFSHCKSLTNINLSNFNTQNVTNMSCMLYECHSLTNIDLFNFNTQNATDISCMLDECNSLIKKCNYLKNLRN